MNIEAIKIKDAKLLPGVRKKLFSVAAFVTVCFNMGLVLALVSIKKRIFNFLFSLAFTFKSLSMEIRRKTIS